MATDESISESSTPDSEWRELCPGCMTSNPPGGHFCAKCGQPLTSYAATGPLEETYARGFVFRSALNGPKSLLVLVGMWLICGTPILCSVSAFLGSLGDGEGLGGLVLMLVIMAITGPFLWKAHANYFRQ